MGTCPLHDVRVSSYQTSEVIVYGDIIFLIVLTSSNNVISMCQQAMQCNYLLIVMMQCLDNGLII